MDARQIVRRGFGFWGMVGVVMTALKLKEHLDDYNRVPTEEDGLGHGPVALHGPNGDEDATFRDGLLDTEIPATRPRKKRSADCCVCCGMRCGLFWKAFGIVCLLVVGWQVIQLIIWAVTPAKTGLENMPKYGTSLGCADAPYIFNGEKTTYNVAFSNVSSDHFIEVKGRNAVGTVLVVEGASDATDIKYELTLRTDDQSLLDHVTMYFPSADEIESGTSSLARLTTPSFSPSSCMRYDVVMYVPPAIKKLRMLTRPLTQVKFDPDSIFEFDTLAVTMWNLEADNMLLPHKGVHADLLSLDVTRGWIVGDIAMVREARLMTQRGDALMNVHVHPTASDEDPPAAVTLVTGTGAGRTDIFYVSNPGYPHRPISSTHRSAMNGDVYLRYAEAGFNGRVNVSAKSWTAMGMQSPTVRGTELPWAGDKDGDDKLKVISPNGWVGVYF